MKYVIIWIDYPLECIKQAFRFTGDEKGLTKYGLVIEEREFDWSVIDWKIKLLIQDKKKVNKYRDQLIEFLDIKAEEAEVEAVSQLEATLLVADQ